MVGTHGGRQRSDLPHVGEHRVPHLGPVQRAEGRSTGDVESASRQLLLQPLGIGGQIAVGAELQPLVARLRQFVQEAGV